ncbi:hypothetical protein F0Q45_18805 [Mycobacterium simiae]|uniref:Protein kinase domain-containing protein n=1 Tax=Mycobacterium simiae TaxID=1784 RepID=A0A5B1BMT1_MYCSI|nr:hypothetical protein [Mycobacterium simiae]KAA1248770.1 hypothetical protein F0Q45_18805 [Mycobacterium simiae]
MAGYRDAGAMLVAETYSGGDPAWLLGTAMAGYRGAAVVSSGGMDTVYLARHPSLPRRDALKILDGSHARDSRFRARFMHAGHRHNLLHRDVQPASMLLSAGLPGEEERVVLADFGIASRSNDNYGPTQTGDVITRTDIYSLGRSLFHLLAGRAPCDDRLGLAAVMMARVQSPRNGSAIWSTGCRGVSAKSLLARWQRILTNDFTLRAVLPAQFGPPLASTPRPDRNHRILPVRSRYASSPPARRSGMRPRHPIGSQRGRSRPQW